MAFIKGELYKYILFTTLFFFYTSSIFVMHYNFLKYFIRYRFIEGRLLEFYLDYHSPG